MSSDTLSPTATERHLLKCLINAAEKASNISRICRANEQLLGLLVQEKIGADANSRFEHDFKTLADVLIQETIKHDVGDLFPEMRDAIKGEESPNFTNKLGETVSISIGATPTETADCLVTVLQGFEDAAIVLAAEVHRQVDYADTDMCDLPQLDDDVDVDYANLGIWIDPIDGTAEYISGDSIFTNFPGITSTGLDCVTVLIGVYNRTTGVPIIGVVSQPFHNKLSDNVYKSLVFWGISLPNFQANNCTDLLSQTRINRLGIFSSSENADILQKLLDLGYEFAFSAGAGHKALKVITCEVDLYLLSKGSTFKWDTCAPQAILRSLGGDIFNFKESVKQQTLIPVDYLDSSEEEHANWKCNEGGLIALRDLNLAEALLEKLNTVADE